MDSGLHFRAIAAACLVASAFLGTPAQAQYADCARLQAQIAQAAADPSGSGRFAAAAQKQRSELDRTVAYAHSIGCDRSGFVFFGPQAPPQCPAINAQIQRMRAKVDQLQGQTRGGPAQTLIAQYNAYCRGGAQVVRTQPRGFFETLFGGNSTPEQPAIMAPLPEDETPRGGSMAVCVKSCDGSFFPVSYSAHRGNLDELNDLCKALCPNAEVTLFTRSLYRDMKSAVSIGGEPYKDLHNAFKFEKALEPSCACKAPGQTWVQALADAERILGNQRRGDMIVTPQQAEEMSRPREAKDTKTRGKPEAAPKKPVEDLTTIEGQAAAQAPTASAESAGISPGTIRGGRSYGIGEGELRDVIGSDGIKRQVRVVGPTL